MSITHLTAGTFESFIDNHDIIFIDFWASWCAPCKVFSQVFTAASENNPDIAFAKIDIEQEPELAEAFEVQSIPHLMVFKQNVIVFSDSGSMPASTLNDLITQARSLDVSKIIEDAEKNQSID